MRPIYLLLLLVLVVSEEELYIPNPICAACHEVLNSIQHTVPPQPFYKILDLIGETYCNKKHLQDKIVCKGAVD